MEDYTWLENRKLRSVDQLRLWDQNPRLNPEENHVSIADYVSDLLSQSGEKDSFLKLIRSIATNGFIPADPIVVWKNTDNEKYYVAEGNRRILALKLLRSPEKAPAAIRGYVRQQSRKLEIDDIKKIKVSVAPSYESSEWYINQRHSHHSIRRPWSRLQAMQWVANLYDKYNGDLDKITSITGQTHSQLQATFRILKIREYALNNEILSQLSIEDQNQVKSHRISMTILERWFIKKEIRDLWGIEYEGDGFKIKSNKQSFDSAYAAWLKLVLHKDDPSIDPRINTRTIDNNLDGILEKLPTVTFNDLDSESSVAGDNSNNNESSEISDDSSIQEESESETTNQTSGQSKPQRPLKGNPNRPKMVVENLHLTTSNQKLSAIFEELKQIPINRYRNVIAASLRVFLDLAVKEYILNENLESVLKQQYRCQLVDITLKQKLEYLKQNNLTNRTPPFKVVEKLLNHTNEHSLDTLNNYIHGNDTHKTNKLFLFGFWDFLYPLIDHLLDIKEI